MPDRAFRRRGLSPSTKRAYKGGLARFARYRNGASSREGSGGYTAGAIDGATITASELQDFMAWLIRKGFAAGTVNHSLWAVRKCASEAHDLGTLSTEEWAMIRLVEGPPVRRERGPIYLTREQVEKLLDYPDFTSPIGRRDRILLRLLCLLGLRRSEAISLRTEHVNMWRREMTIERRKTHSYMTVTFDVRDFRQELEAYMPLLEPPDGFLLRSCGHDGYFSGQSMSGNAVYLRVRKIGEKIGIEGLRPHDLRHSLRARLEEDHVPASEIMEAMGHRTLSGSRQYGYRIDDHWANKATVRSWSIR